MIRIRQSLSKTEYSDTFMYSADASELFTFSSGSVLFQLTLPSGISSGRYALCDSNKYFPDYLLFAVNLEGKYISYPGIYAALSPDGIIFTFWTEYGKFSVIDNVSNVAANESFLVDFCWQNSGQDLGNGATMAIFVNDECTAAGNFLIKTETISSLPFFAFDSEVADFNLQCSIEDVVCNSEPTPDKFGAVDELTHFRFSNDEIVLMGRDGSLLFVDGVNGGESRIDPIRCFGSSQYCVGICDITGDIYFSSFFSDDYSSSSVSKFDVSQSKIVKSLRSLTSPRAISVIQKDGIDYPKAAYYDDSTCFGLWIADSDRVIRTDSDLVIQVQKSGFSDPSCIKCLNDKTCWVSDTDNDLVKRVSFDGQSILNSVAINAPTHIATTINDSLYVYSDTDEKIYLIESGVVTQSVSLDSGVTCFDVYPKYGPVIVGYFDGTVERYNVNLVFIDSTSVLDRIDSIQVRRGSAQDSFLAVDAISSRLVINQLSNPSVEISSYDFSSSVYFNGGIFATARSVGAEGEMEGSFDVDFSVGIGAVTGAKADSYKVDRREVDLSGGGPMGAYLDFKNISSDDNPTDDPSGIIEASEF